MIPILYQTITEGSVPTNYGIGALTDALACEVTEERNGSFELSLSYASEGIHASEIQPNRFIMAKPNYTDDPQIFRIYKVGKTMNGRFEVNAQHISYDLSGKVITTGSASSCVGACALLQTKAGNFTITTDKSVSAPFSVSEPSSVRSWFGGKAGSLLDVYGTAEWKYNNYACSLLSARGADRGVQIRYGKNLTELSQELDMSNLATGVVPFYIDQDGNKTVGTKVSTGLVLDVPRDVAVDFSNDVDPESGTAIATQLATLANKYISNNNLTNILNSITLNFVQLKGLTERVDLCDTVHIFFEALGITATAKCVATTWDVLEDRYTRTTFGDAKTNIADTIATATKQLETTPTTSVMAEAIARATELITGNLGGYVINGHDSNGDGYPDENLIMNTPDISTATKVIRSNLGGIGFSSSGYAGPYTTALNYDGIVANAITTGVLNADLIKAGVISDTAGNSSIDMTSGVATMTNLDAKRRFRLLSSTGVAKMNIWHNSGTGTNLTLYNEAGTDCGGLASSTNGLQVAVNNGSGRQTAQMASGANGGALFIGNTAGTQVGSFTATADGAIVSIDNKSGTLVGYMNANSALGGTLALANSAATITILGSGDTGNLRCVTLTQTSSRKVKDNIKPIEDAGKILELNAVSFDYKDKALGTDKRGFIAEDVAEILPNLVCPEDEENKTPATLDYIGMIPYLQDVLKTQAEEIKELKAEVRELKAKIKTMGG